MLVAIGAAVAVLTGLGAGSRKQDQQEPDPGLCTCRGNRYLRFHYRTSYHLNAEIRKVK